MVRVEKVTHLETSTENNKLISQDVLRSNRTFVFKWTLV